MTHVTGLLLTCFVTIVTLICSRFFKYNYTVTLVVQGLAVSFFSRPVA